MAEPAPAPAAPVTEPVPGPAPAATFTSPPSLSSFQQPLKAFLEARPQFDGVAVGACVFQEKPATATAAVAAEENGEPRRILLVRRAPTDSMPLLWEVPGGACDLEDESLLHAVARELWEETGLVARRVEALVVGPGDGDGGDVFFTRGGRRMCKFTFLVEAESSEEVKLDPNEHVEFLWVSEAEAENQKYGDFEYQYTMPRQKEVVLEAFKLAKRREHV